MRNPQAVPCHSSTFRVRPVDAIIIKSRASSRAAVRVRVRVPGRERLQAAREADGLGGIAHGLRQAHVVPEHADRERVASARGSMRTTLKLCE